MELYVFTGTVFLENGDQERKKRLVITVSVQVVLLEICTTTGLRWHLR